MADIKITIDSSQIRQAQKDTKALEDATTRFSKKLDPLLKKEKAFATAVKQVNDAMRLGVATQKQAIAEIERLGKEFGQTKEQIDRTTASMTGIRKNTNRMNAVIQNAGYQFGDFAVQVQSGQNVLVAFSQQGAQLAGLLPGVAGAVTGIALVIGSSLARALMEGTNLFVSFTGASEDAKEAIEDLTSTADRFGEALQGAVGPGAEKFAETVIRGKFNAAIKEASEQLETLRREIDPMRERSFFDPTGITGIIDANRTLYLLRTGAFEARVELMKLIDTINKPLDFNDVDELDQRLRDITKLIDEFEDQLTPKQLEGLIEAYSAVYDRQRQLQEQQKEITDESDNTADSVEEIVLLTKELVSLHRQLQSLSGSIEETFKRTAIQASLIGEGMDKSISSQVASMQVRLDQEKELLSTLLDEGVLPLGEVAETVANRERQFNEFKANLEAIRSASSAGTGGSRRSQVDAHVKEYERLQQNIEDTLKSYQKQAQLELKLIGLSKEEAELTKFVFDLEKKLGVTREQLNVDQQAQYDAILAAKQKEIELTKQQQEEEEKLAEAKKRVEAVASSLASETVGALKSIANGTKTASEAFRDMALNIIQQIMDILIWQPLIESLTRSISGAFTPAGAGGTGIAGGFISSLFGFQNGGAFSAGNVIPFARGGIVGSPTYFGMAGGRTGLMGEAGPEAIMPLKRGPGGKLGVEGGGNVTVNQTFQFAANGDDSVKKIIAEAAPKIAKLTEAQIINSRQRGGQMRRAFS